MVSGDKGRLSITEHEVYSMAIRDFFKQNDPELWNFKAVSLRSMGRYDEAIECFNKSLEIDPRDKNSS